MALPAPIAYWPFDEASGTTAADASGNGHTATLDHGAWDTSALKKFGAAALANTDGGVGATFTPINLGTVHTVAFWMNGWTGSNDGIGVGGSTSTSYACYFNSTHFYYSDGSTSFNFAHGGLTGARHVVITRSGSACSLYKNGTLVNTGTLGSNAALTVSTLSGWPDNTNALVATLDDVRLYDVALDAAQVAELYALLLVSVAETVTVSPRTITRNLLPLNEPVAVIDEASILLRDISRIYVNAEENVTVGERLIQRMLFWGIEDVTVIDEATILLRDIDRIYVTAIEDVTVVERLIQRSLYKPVEDVTVIEDVTVFLRDIERVALPVIAETVTITENTSKSTLTAVPTPPAYVVQSKSLPIPYANGVFVYPISFDSPPKVGNLVLVIMSGRYEYATQTSIEDNRSHNYNVRVAVANASYRQNLAVWSTVVLRTWSGIYPFTVEAHYLTPYGEDYGSIVIMEIADFDPAMPIAETFATTAYLSSNAPTLPIDTNINGPLLIAAISWTGGTCTPGAGWTQVEEPDEENSDYCALNVMRQGSQILGSYPAVWALQYSSNFQALALAIPPKIYPPGFLRDLLFVTDAVTTLISTVDRLAVDTATISEYTYLVPLSTLPIFVEVSDTVAVADAQVLFYRTTPLGSTQHVDLQWYNLPAGTGGAPVWRSPSGFHDAVNINLDVEGSGITGWPVTVQGRFGNVRIYASTNAGMSYTFTFYKNGSPTNLQIIIADGATSGTSANEVHVVPGDTVTWKCVGVGGPSYMQGLMRQSFYGDVLGESLYGSGSRYSFPKEVGLAVINALAWDRMDSGTGGWNLPYGIQPAVVGTYGRFTTLLVDIYGDSFGPVGATRTFNLVKNGVVLDGTGGTPDTTAVFTNPVYTGGVLTLRQTLTIDVAVVPGDFLLFQCITSDPLAGYTRVYVKWGLKFVADRIGESLGGFIPWDTLDVGTGTDTASTNFRQGSGWYYNPATMHGEPWTWRRLWVWASQPRPTGVVMTPRLNAAYLTALSGTIADANVGVQITDAEIPTIATDAVGVRAVSAPGISETGARYSFGYAQDTGDPGWYGVETVAVTEAVNAAMDIAMVFIDEPVAVTEADTDEETIAVLEGGGDLARQRVDVVLVTDSATIIPATVALRVEDAVGITEAVIFPAADLNLYRGVYEAVTVLDVRTARMSGFHIHVDDLVTVSELLRPRLPTLSVLLYESVTVVEGPLNQSESGLGTTPPSPPGSTLLDYWVAGIQ